MDTVFSALESRLNRDAVRRLANAEVVFPVGAVAVVFGLVADEASVPAVMGGPRSGRQVREYQASAPAEDFAAAAPVDGMVCTVDGVGYVVTRTPTRDSSGWMTVMLRRAG